MKLNISKNCKEINVLLRNFEVRSLFKKIFIPMILTGYILISVSVELHSAFKDSGWGARPLGMGGAFTAIANDSNAPLFNPAGLSQISGKEISFASARLFAGLEGVDVGLNYLSYIHPSSLKKGNLAFTWGSLFSAGYYREDTGSLSYGRTISDLFESLEFMENVDLSLGINVKYLRTEVSLDQRTVNDYVFSAGSVGSALSADLGILAVFPENGISFGFTGKNINRPDVGLKTADYVPNENIFGFAYYNEELPYLNLPYFTVAMDVVGRDNNIDYRIGAETWLFDGGFALRVGGRQQELAFGLGYEIKIEPETTLIIDYAFAWPLEVEEHMGSHRLGLTLRFP